MAIGTYDEMATYLTDGYWLDSGRMARSFDHNNITINVTALQAADQVFATQAMQLWTDVSSLTFSVVTGAADITFDMITGGSNFDGFVTGNTIDSALVHINSTVSGGPGAPLNSLRFATFIHEIGHALGLGHQGDYDVVANYPADATFDNDSWQLSSMSYFSQTTNTTTDGTFAFHLTPQIVDLIAIQNIYGAGVARLGNTTYGDGNNTARASYGTNFTSFPSVTIYDSGGTDTLNYSGSGADQIINLAEEAMSSVYGEVNNIIIARDVTIENATGGSGDDTIYGNLSDNVLRGNDGDDILDGGGINIFAVNTGNDTLYGGGGNDTLRGDDGNDSLYGNNSTTGGGPSTESNNMFGGAGNDYLYGSDGDDGIEGGDGNDFIRGNDGDDFIHGGSGTDTASYYFATGSVDVNLGTGNATGGDGTDTLFSIENFSGSNGYGDVLTGDSGNNVIWGFGGNDIIDGGGGLDTMDGGAGIDTMDVSFWNGTYDWDMVTGGTSFAGETAINFENAITGNGANDIHGNASANTITTNGGNDTVDGGGGNDVIDSGSGNDTVEGNSGNDQIYGGSGNDNLWGGTFGVFAVPGSGNDFIQGGAGNDVINGGDDDDTLFGNNSVSGGGTAGETNTLRGEDGSDSLYGSDGDDDLFGGGGNDFLTGNGGDDAINGGSGTDLASYYNATGAVVVSLADGSASGGDGNDTLTGIENLNGSNSHGDTLTGDTSDNEIRGFGGNDTINGGSGVDTIDGGNGNDTIIETSSGNGDAYDGGNGIDLFISDMEWNDAVSFDLIAGNSTFMGGILDTFANIENLTLGGGADVVGDDNQNIITITDTGVFHHGNTVLAGGGNDVVDTGIGDDLVEGGAGSDTLDGGSGIDTVSYENSNAGVAVNLISGTAGGGHAAGDSITGFENIIGSSFGDVLTGDVNGNMIEGLGGNDTINGSSSADILLGGGGNDTLLGSAGGDQIDGGSGSDTASYFNSTAAIQIDLGAGTASGSHATGDVLTSIENLLGSSFADTLTGDDGSNVLTGGNGVDTLDGGVGNDTLLGQAGNDILLGNAGADFMSGGSGSDTVDYSGSAVAIQVAIGGVNAGGFAAGDTLYGVENIIGTSMNDTIVGSNLVNTLEGGGGADTLNGANSADRLLGGDGSDTLIGGSGGDLLNGGANSDTASYFSSVNGVNVDLFAGTASLGDASGDTLISIENLQGSNTGNDILTGNSLANTLRGNGGADRLMGGVGNDVLSMGNSDGLQDLAIYNNSGFGSDTVSQFENGTDILDMRGLGLGFADVNAVASGANTVLTFAGVSGQITLVDFAAADIESTDFFF